MTPEPAPNEPDLADARTGIDLLANETRLRIVAELGDENAVPSTARDGLPFSELRRRVGVQDSGRFNYHLDKLEGRFVQSAGEGQGGYVLTGAGSQIYQLLVRGTLEADVTERTLDVTADCLQCGTGLSGTYGENGILRVQCPDCGAGYYASPVPPALVATREDERALAAAREWVRNQTRLLARGLCPWCAGTVDRTLSTGEAEPGEDERDLAAYVRYYCGECGTELYSTPGSRLLVHPAVVQFCADRGRDLRSRSTWRLPFAATDDYTTVIGEDPPRVAVTVPAGEEALRVVLDENAAIADTRVERVPE
ncbi:MAG: hypothetical protein ABEJ08_02085 [Halobacteriaceae archaeon]